MSTDWPTTSPEQAAVISASAAASLVAVVTLADVLRRLDVDGGLDHQRAAEMRSAVYTGCRVLGADPNLVLAEVRQLRPRLAKLTPAMAGVSPGRWSNVKSLTLKALKRAGLKSMAGRSREPLAPEWEVLRTLLPNRHWQSGLSRFLSYCTERGTSPAAVTAETFIQFGREVENYSLVRDAGAVYRDTCKLWNLAVRTLPGWPQYEVAVPDRRRNFARDLDDFPARFRADVESFLSRGAEDLHISGRRDQCASRWPQRHDERAIPYGPSPKGLARAGRPSAPRPFRLRTLLRLQCSP
jgi:hypothetical protein